MTDRQQDHAAVLREIREAWIEEYGNNDATDEMCIAALDYALAATTWQPIETLPRDDTVLVVVEATAANTTYGDGGHRKTYPHYIDSGGTICDVTDWVPDKSLASGKWRAVLWMPLPNPPQTGAEHDH